VIWHVLSAVGVGVLLACAVPSAMAAVPDGPRLAFVRETERPDALEVATSDSALDERLTVAGGGIRVRPLPYPRSAPAWSPDGAVIAFSGMIGAVAAIGAPSSRQLYTVTADGTGLRAIPHTRGGFSPVFAPGGRTIAFAKPVSKIVEPHGVLPAVWRGTTVWSVRVDGSGLRQLTEWKNGVEDLPSSFSPDGSVLALTHRDGFRDRADATALRLDSQGSYVLARGAAWPRYSPDGEQIVFLGIRRVGDTSCCERGDGFSVDLYAMNANRSSWHRLTDTPAKAERPASWDPSGQRLAYTTKSAPTESTSGDLEAAVMQINADGTCRSRLAVPVRKARGHHIFFHFPTWRPGPGREAGRISC
jgi:TolB protein